MITGGPPKRDGAGCFRLGDSRRRLGRLGETVSPSLVRTPAARCRGEEMNQGKWDARIRRAGELAAVHPFAAEGLRFYECLARFQKSLYAEIEAACGRSKVPRSPGALRREFDPFLLLPRFAPFLSLIAQVAPPPLSSVARELGAQSGGRWQEILGSRLGKACESRTGGGPAVMDLLATLRRISCGSHGMDGTERRAFRLPALQRKAASGSAAAGRRRREALAHLLGVRN
jgi:hypothetical protein